MSSLKKKILDGVFWTSIETVINSVFSILIQLLLARLLFPEDFGLVGMAVVFISLIEVFNELGMGAALIQKKKELLSPLHFDTAFWTGVIWSILLYILILFIVTPLVVDFYNEEKLGQIIPIMSLGILLNPINLVHKAQLTKEMQFRKLAFINNTSNILAGVLAVTLAFLDYGVWALVLYSLFKVIIAVPLFFNATRWKPNLKWNKEVFKEIFGFGAYTTITSFSNTVSSKIDYLIIGKFVGSSALGYYAFALMLTNILRDRIVSILNKVLYPVYASLQDEKEKMLQLFLKIVLLNILIVYPITLTLVLFSEDIVPIFFGHKWDNAIVIVKILSIAVFIQMLNNSHTTLLRAAGEVKLELNLQLIKSLLFFVPSITIGVLYFGLVGAASGYAIATALGVTTSFFFMNKVFGLRIIQIINVAKVPISMLIFCFLTTTWLKTLLDWRLCLIYYIVSVIIIYYIFAKPTVLPIIKTIRSKLHFNKM